MKSKLDLLKSAARGALKPWPVVLTAALTVMTLSQARSQPSADGAAAGLPAGPGRDVVAQTCSNCHALGLAIGKRHTPEEWTSVIQMMIGRGAQIDAAQEAQIHDYLSAHFAPASEASVTAPRPGEATASQASAGPAVTYPRPSGPNQWPTYGGGNAQLNYSPLTQITPQNVKTLKRAWTYHYGAGIVNQGDQGLDYRFEVTPLIIGGVMYISTPESPARPGVKASIVALKPETGEVIWKYESPLNIHGRGIAYWPGDAKTAPRIIFATDKGMISAVDVTTGKPAKGFGRNGQIDAYVGVVSERVGESRRDTYTVPNPVTIYKNLFITAARPGEVGPPGPRGDIRAWDVRTGRLVWDFHTIPWPGEPGHEGYKDDQWRDLTGANTWSTMTLDEASGTLFAATGDANAPPGVAGKQLYSSSLLALDAATGKLKWYHQITHHDVWDWDSPTPTVLTEVKKDGKMVPAILLTGKHSLFFEFDRRDGTPLNGFTERPTPQPAKPDPNIWPTQPFPDAPGPLARIQMTRDEIPDLVPGMKAACEKIWDDNKTVSGPLYTVRRNPDHATITGTTGTGGPNWGGGSFNPETRLYVINVQDHLTFTPASNGEQGMGHASPDESAPPPAPRARASAGSAPARRVRPQGFSFTTPDGVNLPCTPTPWAELVAVNVDTHQIAWRAPLGTTEGIGPKGVDIGTGNIGGNITTKSGLIFIGATNDRRLRAFDARTGKKLWETEMEASGASTPITYMGADGKQYVVIAAGGGTSAGKKLMSDTLVAYALP
jgi:quinoprotein glucose dehydrogenase